MFWGTLYSITQLTKDDAVSSSYQPTEESRKLKVYPTSGRFVTGPLLGCKAPVLCDVGLADANSDKSLRWPSSNSDVAPWFIDDAELIAS